MPDRVNSIAGVGGPASGIFASICLLEEEVLMGLSAKGDGGDDGPRDDDCDEASR